MLYFQADPRDGGPKGSTCSTGCCCESIYMKPGEVNLIQIDYAAWSLPIGGPGIVPTFEYSMEADDSACPEGTNNDPLTSGGPPVNTEYRLIMAMNTGPLQIDMTGNEAPGSTGAKTYSIVPLTGPANGQLNMNNFDPNGIVEYTPRNGFRGYDYFSYKMCDNTGRCIVRNVQIAVLGDTAVLQDARDGSPDLRRMSIVPYVRQKEIVTNQRLQYINFPLYMPYTCRPCESYTMTLRQMAQDCDGRAFSHDSCFTIRCKECN